MLRNCPPCARPCRRAGVYFLAYSRGRMAAKSGRPPGSARDPPALLDEQDRELRAPEQFLSGRWVVPTREAAVSVGDEHDHVGGERVRRGEDRLGGWLLRDDGPDVAHLCLQPIGERCKAAAQ